MWNTILFTCAIFVLISPHFARAEDSSCPSVAVIVVASVFGTIAVVLVVVGIIALFLWKRRRDVGGPARVPLKKEGDGSEPASPDFAYSNPAFAEDTPKKGAGLSAAEVGAAGYVQCRDFVPQPKKSPAKVTPSQESSKKTWSSLPRGDFPGSSLNRSGSIGSLDRNDLAGDPEVVSVWLQSQDFIGLGFNIAGSMRDGIYVSQVHNRGPAIESGKFKVGDKIVSITISFENMVYEDALTILSYASPYPVKVSLQKEKQLPKNRKVSDTNISLSHPLYRSQSVDTLLTLGKEPIFHPKRSASEVRYDKRDSPKTFPRVSKNAFDHQEPVIEGNENFTSPIKINVTDDVFAPSPSPKMNAQPEQIIMQPEQIVTQEITVHRVESDRVEKKDNLFNDRSFSIDTGLPDATVDLSKKGSANGLDQMDGAPQHQSDVTPTPPSTASDFADLFDKLTEEDKLDVIRLSYEDPDEAVNNNINLASPPTELRIDADIKPEDNEVDLRTPPIKPERKKKRSSTGSSTPSHSESDIPGSPSSPRELTITAGEIKEDILVTNMVAVESAPPPPAAFQEDLEIDEDIIMPEVQVRDVHIEGEKIVLEPRGDFHSSDLTMDTSALSIVDTTIVNDISSSSLDETLVRGSPSPDPVEEEEIAATQLKRGELEVPPFKPPPIPDEDSDQESVTRERKGSTSSSSSSDDEKEDVAKKAEPVDQQNDHTEEGSAEKHQSVEKAMELSKEEDLEPDFPKLDMNLNFETDSILFKETFPSRNTKETEGGMSYDITVNELEAMENKVLEEKARTENQPPKGGIAFEVREDAVTGETRTINNLSVHRTVSYELKSSSLPSVSTNDNEYEINRISSLKDAKEMEALNSDITQWSGQRLVRSGSFSEIPQTDSLNDWTDVRDLEKDDEAIERHIHEDQDFIETDSNSNRQEMKKLTRATLLKARENTAEVSDTDSQGRSISTSSSSRSSSPTHENGQDDGLGTSPETSPVKITPTADTKIDLVSAITKLEGHDEVYTVTVNAGHDDEADC